MRWYCGFRGRRAKPAKTPPNSTSWRARRRWRRCWPRSPRCRGCAPPRLANSPGGLSERQARLTRVEGLADLIGAETQAQRRQAFRQLKGLLGDRAELAHNASSRRWPWSRRRSISPTRRYRLICSIRHGDPPPHCTMTSVHCSLTERGERLRDGLTVAVAGGECRQIEHRQPAGETAGGDRVALCRHHA